MKCRVSHPSGSGESCVAMCSRKRKGAASRLAGDHECSDGAENGNDGDIGEQLFAATAAQRATPLGVEPFLQGFEGRLRQFSMPRRCCFSKPVKRQSVAIISGGAR